MEPHAGAAPTSPAWKAGILADGPMRHIMQARNCELCEKEFYSYDSRRRFCGRSCSAKHNNRDRAIYKCRRCNKPTHRSNLEFCSANCKTLFLTEEWLAGRKDGGTKYGYVRSFVRQYLHQRSHSQCEQCGFDKVCPSDGKTILQVDHIDGDCMNSSLANVRLICPNCHAMTPTYCGKNSNSGRSWKKKYYASR